MSPSDRIDYKKKRNLKDQKKKKKEEEELEDTPQKIIKRKRYRRKGAGGVCGGGGGGVGRGIGGRVRGVPPRAADGEEFGSTGRCGRRRNRAR